MHAFDRRTDRQTRITRPRLHSMQRGKTIGLTLFRSSKWEGAISLIAPYGYAHISKFLDPSLILIKPRPRAGPHVSIPYGSTRVKWNGYIGPATARRLLSDGRMHKILLMSHDTQTLCAAGQRAGHSVSTCGVFSLFLGVLALV